MISNIDREQIARQDIVEQERRYREHLENALDKLDGSLAPGRRRPRALTFDEMRALRQFVRKFKDD